MHKKHIIHLHHFLRILNKIGKTLQNQHVHLEESDLKKPRIYYWSKSFDSRLTQDWFNICVGEPQEECVGSPNIAE